MALNSSRKHIAIDILSRTHEPSVAASIFSERVLHRPLILRPTSPDPASQDARSARRRQRLRKDAKTRRQNRPKPRPLSAKEKRVLGVHDVPSKQQRYDLYEPLHGLWLGYMREILGIEENPGAGPPERPDQAYVTAQSAGSMLASADFHGAEFEVVRSKCVDRVGAKGIVLKDTKFTFVLITRKNAILTIPKKGSVFRFTVPLTTRGGAKADDGKPLDETSPSSLVFELYGSQFENRAVDRATKKFKSHPMGEL